jgi:hypothetical protein
LTDQILEMADITVSGVDTVTGLKVHQIAYDNSGHLAFASLIAPANAVKLWRGGLTTGMKCRYQGDHIIIPKGAKDACSFRQAGLGRGYVHCVTRYRGSKAILLLDDSEWLAELLRISTVPIAPEFVPYLRRRIEDDGRWVRFNLVNCEAKAYRVDDGTLERYLVEGGTGGEINLPECGMDMGELSGLPDYIRAYAQVMVDSAGSSMQPLLHPERETVTMPALGRQPFVPQAWLIEGARRAMMHG